MSTMQFNKKHLSVVPFVYYGPYSFGTLGKEWSQGLM